MFSLKECFLKSSNVLKVKCEKVEYSFGSSKVVKSDEVFMCCYSASLRCGLLKQILLLLLVLVLVQMNHSTLLAVRTGNTRLKRTDFNATSERSSSRGKPT